MKKLYVFLLIALIGTMFLACQSDDDNDVNDYGAEYLPDTRWYFSEYLSMYDSDTTLWYYYDPSTDDYFRANVIEFTDSLFIDNEGNSRVTNRPIMYGDTTIAIDSFGCGRYSILKFEFIDDKLVLHPNQINEISQIYIQYTEDFPPASWSR